MWQFLRRQSAVSLPEGLIYRAFISYSRKDAAFAQRLHRQLARWRTPHGEVGREGRHGPLPDAVGPVFIDTLNASSGRQVHDFFDEQLKQSQSLIVLCSPNSASPDSYVNVELARYKTLRPGGAIVPTIISGDPPDCFPRGLAIIDSEGRTQWPLAADLRGGASRETRADGVSKLIAGVLGVENADRFIQSAKRQRRTRRVLIGAVAASLFAIIGYAVGWVFEESRRTALIEYGGPGWVAALPAEGSIYPFGNAAATAEARLAQAATVDWLAAKNDPHGTWCRDSNGVPSLSSEGGGLRIWSSTADGSAEYYVDESRTNGCDRFAATLDRFVRIVDDRTELWSIRPARRIAILADQDSVEPCRIASETPLKVGVSYPAKRREASACFAGDWYKLIPDAKRVLTGNNEHTVVHVWSIDTGARIASVRSLRPIIDEPSYAYDPGSRTLATGFGRQVYLTDIQTGAERARVELGDEVQQLHFSANANQLVITAQTGLHVIETGTGKISAFVRLSDDGKDCLDVHRIRELDRVLVECKDKLLLIDVANGRTLSTLPSAPAYLERSSLGEAVVVGAERIAPTTMRLVHKDRDSLLDVLTGQVIFSRPRTRFLAFGTTYGLLEDGDDLRFVNLHSGATQGSAKWPFTWPKSQNDPRTPLGFSSTSKAVSADLTDRRKEQYFRGDRATDEVEFIAGTETLLIRFDRRLVALDANSGEIRVDTMNTMFEAARCRAARLEAYQLDRKAVDAIEAADKSRQADGKAGDTIPIQNLFRASSATLSLHERLIADAREAALPDDVVPSPFSLKIESGFGDSVSEVGDGNPLPRGIDKYISDIAARIATCSGVDDVRLSDEQGEIIASDKRAHITHVWDIKSGRLLGLMPGVLFDKLTLRRALVTRFGRATVAVSSYSGIAELKLFSLDDEIRESSRMSETNVVLIVGNASMMRIDADTGIARRIELPANPSLPNMYLPKRYYLFNWPDRIELYDAVQDRSLGSRPFQRRPDDEWPEYAVNDKVEPIEPGSIVATSVTANRDGAQEVTVIDLSDGRLLQAGPSEGDIASFEDAPRRGMEGPPPAGVFLFERRSGRFVPTRANALRRAYCQRLSQGRQRLLAWPRPNSDGASEEAVETRRAEAAALGYAIVGSDVVRLHVCDDRGPLSLDYWRELPTWLRLKWG